MTYCTVEEIQSKTGFTYTGETQPSSDQVTAICEAIAIEIDGHLKAANYLLPITNEDALKLLGQKARLGAAYQAWHDGIQQDDEPAHVTAWGKTYRDFLREIKDGDLALPGHEPQAVAGGMTSVPVVRQDGYATHAQTVREFS